MKNKKIFNFTILIVFLFFFSGGIYLKKHFYTDGKLNVFLNSKSYSCDPFEFNYFDNRPLIGSVHSTLFSSYKDGKLTPILVKEWKNTDSDRVWIFKIREDVRFSDGELITPEDVKNSFKRIFILANKTKSNQPLLSNVVDANKLRSISDEIFGLESDKVSFTIRLKESDPQLIEKLTFGLYSVVSSKNYDANNYTWNNSRTVFSGPYKIINEDENNLLLLLREDFPKDLHSARAFNKILITWDKNKKDFSDLISTYYDENELIPSGFSFYGNTNSFLSYLRIYSWNNEGSFLSKKSNRICLRNEFYKKLKKTIVKPVSSIYPLVLPGVQEIELGNNYECKKNLVGEIKIRFIKNIKIKKYAVINKVLNETFDEFGFLVKKVEFESVEETKKLAGVYGPIRNSKIDAAVLNTDIGNEDPRYTTKFMFSKDGIYLPDPTGKIGKIINQQMFALNDVNKLLFEDAIIWPIFHYSMGFYIRKNKVNLNEYSHQLPLSELQWMSEL